MQGMPFMQDVGAFLHVLPGGNAIAQFDSGSASPGATSTGTVLDRLSTNFPRRYGSAIAVLPYTLTLASGRSFSLVATVKHRSTTASVGSTWESLATGTKSKTKVGSTTTFNGTEALVIRCNLKQAKRFLKVNYHKTFNSTVTGVLVSLGAPLFVLGGADENPAAG